MKITILTLFPEMFEGFLNSSILRRAQEKGLVEIQIVQLRNFADDPHGTVDDRPYGGAAGMVLKPGPVKKALDHIVSNSSDRQHAPHVIMTSARGTSYSQEVAERLSQLDNIVILAGHYEAFDERISQWIDEEISIGDFVLTGGELPAATIVDSIVRLLPGVLKKEQATAEESFSLVSIDELIGAVGETKQLSKLKKKGFTEIRLLEYPHYTRPDVFEGLSVPDVLLSGNHAEIRTWQLREAYRITLERRPGLLS